MSGLDSLATLIVDDHDASRALMAQALKQKGARVREASDGGHALELLNAEPASLILVDQLMPGMDGVELIKAVRGEPAIAGARIVMITGYTEAGVTKSAEAAGADLILAKPLAPSELVAALEAFLAKR